MQRLTRVQGQSGDTKSLSKTTVNIKIKNKTGDFSVIFYNRTQVAILWCLCRVPVSSDTVKDFIDRVFDKL